MKSGNDGYVYFIRKEGQDIFKIGMTYKSPKLRLEQIQVNTPDRLSVYGAIYTKNPRALEAELHQRFHKNKLQGEWFSLPEKTVKSYLESHPNTVEYDWIELRQGHRIFWYQVSTNELYIDFRSLRNFSQLYLASLFSLRSDHLKVDREGSLAVRYDILVEDWPTMAKELREHKEILLAAAKSFIECKQGVSS